MPPLYLLIPCGLVVSAVLIICIFKLTFTLTHRRLNDLPQAKTDKLLKNFARIRSFKVLKDIDLPMSDGRIAHIDNLLIGFFGIMLVKSQGEKGIIYGDYKSAGWNAVTGKEEKGRAKKSAFKNPVPLLEEGREAIRSVLTSHKVYKVDIEHYVVFQGRVNLAVTKGLPVMDAAALKKLLRKQKYSADGAVNVENIADLLLNAAVK